MIKKSPPTTTGYVMDSIREGILDGRYPLGSRLDQKAIAINLGVSVVPVREAIRQLEGEGLIQLFPRRGAFVTDVSMDALEELYLIREDLEILATRHAVPNLTSQDLTKLTTIIQQMEQASTEQEYANLLDLNQSFHFTIYASANMPLLVEMLNSLWARSALYRRVFTFLPERTFPALHEHKDIYAACLERNVETAVVAIRYNIRQTVAALLEEFQNNENPTIQPVI